VRVLKAAKFTKFIVLEDFHYLPEETQTGFAFALKTVHETSKITFIVVAVWREENRLIVYNGDLAGRVISVDADAWSAADLRRVIATGEDLLNVRFPEKFISDLIVHSLSNVYVVQDVCYGACKNANINSTSAVLVSLPQDLDAGVLVSKVIEEQGARYNSFLINFAAGFQDTQLEMFRWLLYPILTAEPAELEAGLSYGTIRRKIQSKHPQGAGLNAGNLTQSLNSVPNLQARKNIKPFILDYDRSNLRLSVVEKGFLIWLAAQKGPVLLEMIDLPRD
jgi:hypothetical protein